LKVFLSFVCSGAVYGRPLLKPPVGAVVMGVFPMPFLIKLPVPPLLRPAYVLKFDTPPQIVPKIGDQILLCVS